jgi:hypothetical protein
MPMIDFNSFRNLEECLAFVIVLKDEGSGFFLFEITC